MEFAEINITINVATECADIAVAIVGVVAFIDSTVLRPQTASRLLRGGGAEEGG
jgi:hypothetical protein